MDITDVTKVLTENPSIKLDSVVHHNGCTYYFYKMIDREESLIVKDDKIAPSLFIEFTPVDFGSDNLIQYLEYLYK